MRTTKKIMLLTVLASALMLLAGCAAQTTGDGATAAPTTTAAPQEVTLKVFNTEELAKNNGQDGNPAYIAVDGKVYDVSDMSQWKDGSHFGRFQAGADLTEEMKTISPHGVSKLDSVPIVGLYEP